MKKILCGITAVFVLGLGMTGCDLNPAGTTESEAAKVTMNMPETLSVSTTTAVTGKITADENITNVKYAILNSSGAEAAGITATGPSINGDDKYEFKGQELKIIVGANVAAGTYKLQITVTAGPEASILFPFYVKGSTGTPVTTETVDLGAHDNGTTGSSINLDNGSIMLAAQAVLANSGVDIVYTYSQKITSPVIMTPYYAKNSSGITAFSGWVNPNNTQYHKVSGVNFSSIQTAEQIAGLFNASLVAAEGRLSVAVNDIIVVKTDLNAYVLVQINTVSADARGTATIKYAK